MFIYKYIIDIYVLYINICTCMYIYIIFILYIYNIYIIYIYIYTCTHAQKKATEMAAKYLQNKKMYFS